jgi:NADH-quinone oxidoreductase subunit M
MYRRVMFGPCDNPENRALLDLDLREKAILAALLIPIFWIGVYPNYFTARLDGSVSELLQTMEVRKAAALEAAPRVRLAAGTDALQEVD